MKGADHTRTADHARQSASQSPLGQNP